MKKLITLILAAVVMLSCFAVPAYGESANFTLEAEAAILIDLTTGKVLYEKNADEQLYPASTTKIMTCILALENLDQTKSLYIDDEVHATGGSVLGLKREEEISVKDVIWATMVRSANDGAVALAKGVSGSVDNFAQLMNRKAKELGCTGTNFVNPHGLHNSEHVSTARDLSLIALYCMNQSEYSSTFRKIVAATSYTVPATNKNEAYTVVTTNYLLNDEQDKNRIYVGNELRYCKYDGCIGVKTGYTSQAGGCLIAAAEKNGTELLSVVLKSSTYGRFADSIKLLDWGFANSRTMTVLAAGESMGTIAVHKGEFNKVETELAETITATVPSEASDSIITWDKEMEEVITAPIAAGVKVGTLHVYESGQDIGSYDIITSSEVVEGGILSTFDIEDQTAHWIFMGIIGFFALVIFGFIGWILYMRKVTREKKARRAAKIKAKKEAEAKRRASWEDDYNRRYTYYDDEDPFK